MTHTSWHLSQFDDDSVRAAFEALRGGVDAVVFAMVAEADAARVGALQRAAAEAGVRLLGAVFPGLLVDAGFEASGVCLVRLERVVAAVLLADVARDGAGQTAAAGRLSEALFEHLHSDDPLGLWLFVDAMNPSVGSFLDALYLQFGDRVSYRGASAGSETFKPTPCLFDGDRIVGDGVLALLQRSPRPSAIAHGYPTPSRVMTATSTVGNRIEQIDWRPAFEVYREIAASEYGVEIDRGNFYEYGVHFPFGLVRTSGEILVRIPVALEADGSLFCVGEVPSNSLLALLDAPKLDVEANAAALVRDLDEQGVARSEGAPVWMFYCAGRRLHLGLDAARAELAVVRRRAGDARLCGALSLGEIGSAHGWTYPNFHNAALLLHPLSEP